MKKALLISLKIVLLFCPFALGSKQDYYFNRIDTEKGLSQNTVLSILQDKTGFMWFGTKDGLNRYDGNTVKVYKRNKDDTFSLGNNIVWSLLETDNGNIWVGTDKGIYIFDPYRDHFTFFDKQTENGESITTEVLDMKRDHNGDIWIASHNLFRYSPETEKLETFLYVIPEYPDGTTFMRKAWSIHIDSGNEVWVSILHGGIKKYDPDKNKLISFMKDDDNNNFTFSQISNMIPIDSSALLIGSFNDGLRIMDKTTGRISPYSMSESVPPDLFVRSMGVFSDGNYWVGTESGLYIHNPVTKGTTHLTHNINDRYSLSDNVVYSLYEDREGGIWAGTYFGGVNYYPLPYSFFEKHYPVANKNSIAGERVSGICEDKNGNIWIGTEDAGLTMLDTKTGHFHSIIPGNPAGGLNYHNVHDVIADGDLLWIGTFSHGINVYNLKTKEWKYYQKGDQEGMLNNNDIFALFRDSSGNIWVGTSNGTFLFDRRNDKFIRQNYMEQHFVSDILEDARGNIWFSTYDHGVFCYNVRTKECKNYMHDPEDPFSLCYHKITCMYLDSKKRLWFGAEPGGICMFDDKVEKFITYDRKDGFSNDVIYKILEDYEGNLWLSGNLGLIRFNPDTKHIRVFTQNNGLPNNQFNYKSGFRDKSGRMYFGSISGLVTFQPADFRQNETVPQVAITDLCLLNNKRPLGNHCGKNVVTLPYNQSSFSIDFAAFSYVAPEMNRYTYIMEGLEDRWNDLSSAQKITYSNLPPGKYTFRVKAANNDGLWNESGDFLVFHIRPPFWRTIWAYISYGILFVVMVGIFLYYYRRRIEKENKRQQIDFESKKEKEIYDSKIEFFTNVAHEVRTPLTLIKGPLEYILKTDPGKEELKNNLNIMEKNADRLLSLINQLLDFRETEAQGFSLAFIPVNINELLGEVYTRFRPLAKQKSIEFNVSVPVQPVIADVDKEALTKIISNLFSNAVKYADKEILVELTSDEQDLRIQVKNDGLLIPAASREEIFEAFFRLDKNNKAVKTTGSGIGLALVKSLTELHNGMVYLDVPVEDKNCFVLSLPLKQKSVIGIHEVFRPEVPVPASPEKEKELPELRLKDAPAILIAEDNEELLQFIVQKLSGIYTIFKARNGVEAIEILQKEIISLVISDIMMPKMDGLELCKKIKEEMEYSHIPVILLTAKTNLQSKISGLGSGADAYIEKPFSLEFLEAQIANLLKNREKIRKVFVNSPLVHSGSISMTKADEQFLNKLTEIVYKNMADKDFGVEHLAEQLNMSHSSLLRKIRGISDATPNDFVRLIRLKRAAEILAEGKYKVNEVCFLVGFSSTSYFAKVFQKQFGVFPKDFLKSLKKPEEEKEEQQIGC